MNTNVSIETRRVSTLQSSSDLEAAVLSAAILDQKRLVEIREVLTGEDFGGPPHRLLFRAICELSDAGRGLDILTIHSHLEATERLDRVGGTLFLSRIIDATPAIANVLDHAREVRAHAEKRLSLESMRRAVAELESGEEPKDVLARVSDSWARLQERQEPSGSRLELIGVDEIFAELPPIPYLLRDLDICPGAPTLFAGLGFSGKTLLAHALGLAVACEAPAWGCLSAKPGKVVFIDYEQGQHLTRRRIQRMARGMGLIPEGDSLRLTSMPSLYADDPEAEVELRAACQGTALCVIDSLSAACPSLEENSASARRTLDMLGRVSEATGCVIIVIHHAKKPSKDDTGGARNSIRGSGALFDAAGCVVVFERQTDGTIVLKHEKARTSGTLAKRMVATIADTGDGGLSVTVETPPEPAELPDSTRLSDSRDAMDSAVFSYVNAHPGCTGRQIRAEVTGSDKSISDAIVRLDMRRRIYAVDGPRRSQYWHATVEAPQ